MNYKNKIILGTILLILGIFSLVFGILLYTDTTDGLLFVYSLHLLVFEFVLARLLIGWGLGFISTAIVLFVMGALKTEFKSRKPMAIALAILIIAVLFSGFLIYAAIPPPLEAKAALDVNSQYTEVGTEKPVIYNVSAYSNYHSCEYFNVSLKGKNVYNESELFSGYFNTSYNIPPSTFSSPGNYSVATTITHGSSKKVFTSWIDVKAYSPMKISITGPNEITDGYTATYSAQVSGGYGPDVVHWCISGEHGHKLTGDNVSFTFGDYYYGYNIQACVFDKYGEENTTSMTAYLVSNLSASYSCSYPQLDQYMTDTFNASTYSGFQESGVGPYTYSWYDNGNLFSTSENTTYTFQNAGMHNITLEVKDVEGQTSNYSQNIKVNPRFGLWSYYPTPPPSQVTGSQCVDFWYNVTGGTWYQNVSGSGHYDATFYVNGEGYYPDNSFYSNGIGHYEFTLSSYDLNAGENSFKVVVQDGVGQTSVLSIDIEYSS